MGARTDDNMTRLGLSAWYGALWLAVVAGILHVTELFSTGLSIDTLTDAGRGVMLLLIALGLVGNARLALILAFLVSAHALTRLAGGVDTLSIVVWAEFALLACSVTALFAAPMTPRQADSPTGVLVEPNLRGR